MLRDENARAIWILLFLLLFLTPGLTGQVGTEPREPSLAPPGSVRGLPEPPVFLTIDCENSAVDLVLADPQNRRLGNDPFHHQAYDEIPGAYIAGAGKDDETGVREEDPAEVMNLRNPESGRYRLTLIGARDGTYSCLISASLENGVRREISLRNRPLRRDEIEQVQFSFDPKSSSFLVPLDAAVTRP